MSKALADSLRALADKVESLPEGLSEYCEFKAHRIDTIERLRAMVALMSEPRRYSVEGTHWIEGEFAGVKVTAFYQAGLLGKVRRERVVVCDVEDADMSLLMEPAACERVTS